MSGYTPIDDNPAQTHKEGRSGAGESYSSQSHPYSSGYGMSTSPNYAQQHQQYQKQQDASQVIEVSPPPPSSLDYAGSSSSGYGHGYIEPTAGPSTFSSQEGGQRISRYETSLSLRYDVEAALAYILGIFSGAFLLIFEKTNDYVRFHAWQSSLLSVATFIALIGAALLSNFLYWIVLLATVACHLYMARRAYIDGAIFERFTLPYIGSLACQAVDEE